MKNRTFLSLCACALAILTACGEKDVPDIDPASAVTVQITKSMADSIWSAKLPDAFIDVESEYVPQDSTTELYYKDFYENWIDERIEETRDVIFTFDGDKVTYTFEDGSKKTPKFVKITTDGAHVTIHNDSLVIVGTDTIASGRARMNYILTGESDNGSLRIYSNKKFLITLDQIKLTNQRGAAINIQKSFDKKRAFIRIADYTDNTLCDAAIYTDTVPGEDDKACLFSEGKLIFFGEKIGNGKLTVTGNHAHGIASDSRIYIHKGVTIVVDSAAKDAIHCDALVMGGGSVTSFGQKDGVQCDEEHAGILLKGGRLLTAAKRAFTAPTGFTYEGGEFCGVGNETASPNTSSSVSTWMQTNYTGYKVVYSY